MASKVWEGSIRNSAARQNGIHASHVAFGGPISRSETALSLGPGAETSSARDPHPRGASNPCSSASAGSFALKARLCFSETGISLPYRWISYIPVSEGMPCAGCPGTLTSCQPSSAFCQGLNVRLCMPRARRKLLSCLMPPMAQVQHMLVSGAPLRYEAVEENGNILDDDIMQIILDYEQDSGNTCCKLGDRGL